MIALTVRQPWAWATMHGKDVENRSQPRKYRGELIIHAGQKFDSDGYAWLWDNRHLLDAEIPTREKFKLGGIIGKVNMVDCVKNSDSPWAQDGFHHWVFESPVELQFFAMPGRQNFFPVPDDKIKVLSGQQ